MQVRPKTFLTFLAIFLTPLILISGLSYWGARRLEHHGADAHADITSFNQQVDALLDRQEGELVRLAGSPALIDFLVDRAKTPTNEPSAPLKSALASVLNNSTHFVAVAAFDQNKNKRFVAEGESGKVVFRQKDFFPGQLQPDEQTWSANKPQRSSVIRNPLRASLRITVPVNSASTSTPIGVLLGEVEIDSLLREAAVLNRAEGSPEIVVTDDSGTVLYHPNPALLHQPVALVNGHLTQARRIPGLNLQAAAIDQSPSNLSARRLGVGLVMLSLALAGIAAFLVTRSWERRTSGIERVTAGVAAIAHGDLDHRIEALSSDAIRPLSENLNLVTAQLREQIARETEARQFQSFVRLSAMLTHDLKNAIEAVSLIVSNMERHFDNEAFRADAMKSLNLATQNLRSLVDRLTNPVTTLSGEYKRPQPIDLVPLLKRVVKLTATPVLGEQQIELDLPESLSALGDEERIEKVMENLVLNAVEAMGGMGRLSVAAAAIDKDTVSFSISDTGPGMSRDFVEGHLFRPFATTKKRGVGLGLYTCREVVRANAGSIEVNSREGAGTTFRVVLPSATNEKV